MHINAYILNMELLSKIPWKKFKSFYVYINDSNHIIRIIFSEMNNVIKYLKKKF